MNLQNAAKWIKTCAVQTHQSVGDYMQYELKNEFMHWVDCAECDGGVIENDDGHFENCECCEALGIVQADWRECNCSECQKQYFVVDYATSDVIARFDRYEQAVARAMKHAAQSNHAADVYQGIHSQSPLFETNDGVCYKFKQAA